MSSMDRQSGAVHILFLIFVLVIAIVFGALWFTEVQKNDELTASNTNLKADAELAIAKHQFSSRCYELIAPVSWKKWPQAVPFPADQDILETPADDVLKGVLDEAKRDLGNLAAAIEAPGITPQDFRGAWGDMENKIESLKTLIRDKDQTIAQLKADKAEKDNQIAQINASKAADRTSAEEQHAAALDNLKNQNADLRSQNQAFSDKNRELTEENRQVSDKANRDVQKAIGEKLALEGQVNQIKSSLRLARETEKPDGNVVRVDPVDGIVWIDIGSNKMLLAGTRFKVYETGKGGLKIPKGFIRVTRLYPDKAECRVDEAGMGEIDSGDWIYNPYYSPEKHNHFVFLGELPGGWSRTTVESLLKSRGCVIDPSVTVKTDFLVMGVQESEEAEPLTESADYRRALQYGIQVLRARDLEPYLKF